MALILCIISRPVYEGNKSELDGGDCGGDCRSVKALDQENLERRLNNRGKALWDPLRKK